MILKLETKNSIKRSGKMWPHSEVEARLLLGEAVDEFQTELGRESS